MRLRELAGGASLPMHGKYWCIYTVATVNSILPLLADTTDSLITHAIIVQQYLLKPVTTIITLHWATCPDYS